jgi:pimeloyl-ACP methyl ester carboxylesterase
MELILLPGMMCDDRLFTAQLSALRDRASVKVASISGYNQIEQIAKDVLSQVRDEQFALAGLSMGGIVAMEVVRQAPERVLQLALLNTNHLSDTTEKREIRSKQIARVLSGGLAKVLIEEMKPLYLAPQNSSRDDILQTVVNMALDLGESVFIRQSEALANRRDYSETLQNYFGKTLVLAGEHDALCPPERHQAIADLLPNATLKIVPKCGHLSTMESPDSVNTSLFNWLNKSV